MVHGLNSLGMVAKDQCFFGLALKRLNLFLFRLALLRVPDRLYFYLKELSEKEIFDFLTAKSERRFCEFIFEQPLTGAWNTDGFSVFSPDHLCGHCHFAAFGTDLRAGQGGIRRHNNIYLR